MNTKSINLGYRTPAGGSERLRRPPQASHSRNTRLKGIDLRLCLRKCVMGKLQMLSSPQHARAAICAVCKHGIFCDFDESQCNLVRPRELLKTFWRRLAHYCSLVLVAAAAACARERRRARPPSAQNLKWTLAPLPIVLRFE